MAGGYRYFRLRASDFLSRQKVTKDRLKDPWSLRIPFASKPVACLPLNPALRKPTRPGPACCRPWVGEGPSTPDGKAPCVGGDLRRGRPWPGRSRFCCRGRRPRRPGAFPISGTLRQTRNTQGGGWGPPAFVGTGYHPPAGPAPSPAPTVKLGTLPSCPPGAIGGEAPYTTNWVAGGFR